MLSKGLKLKLERRDAYRKTQPVEGGLRSRVKLLHLLPPMTVVVAVGVVMELEAKEGEQEQEPGRTVDRQWFFHQPATVVVGKAGCFWPRWAMGTVAPRLQRGSL